MRVSERAQQAVLNAKREAGRLGHDRVGTEHLLLGLLGDEQCLAVAALGGLDIEPATIRRRVEETIGQGPGESGMGFGLPITKAFTLVLSLAGRETMELGHDRLGTEELLLGLAREGEGVAARVLQELGGGLLELREAVVSRYAAGVDPEPFPPDRGPPPWQPPPSASLRRVIPLAREHRLPSGDQLVLLSLEVWSDWLDLRYAVVYARPLATNRHRAAGAPLQPARHHARGDAAAARQHRHSAVGDQASSLAPLDQGHHQVRNAPLGEELVRPRTGPGTAATSQPACRCGCGSRARSCSHRFDPRARRERQTTPPHGHRWPPRRGPPCGRCRR